MNIDCKVCFLFVCCFDGVSFLRAFYTAILMNVVGLKPTLRHKTEWPSGYLLEFHISVDENTIFLFLYMKA